MFFCLVLAHTSVIISLLAQNAYTFYDYCQLILSFLIGLFYALVFFEVYFLIVLMVLIFSQVAIIFNFQTLNKQLSCCIKVQIASCSKQGKTVPKQPKLLLPLQLARFWALHQRTTACVLHFGRQVASPNIFVFFLTNFRFHVFLVVTIFFRSVPARPSSPSLCPSSAPRWRPSSSAAFRWRG